MSTELVEAPPQALQTPQEITPAPWIAEAIQTFGQLRAQDPSICESDPTWVHTFTKDKNGKSNLYTRSILMKAGRIEISRLHLSEHPYVVLKGRVQVIDQNGVGEEIVAPYFGVTKPGTQRVIKVLEDTIWITFHATDKTDIDEIGREILYQPPCTT